MREAITLSCGLSPFPTLNDDDFVLAAGVFYSERLFVCATCLVGCSSERGRDVSFSLGAYLEERCLSALSVRLESF